MDAVGIGIGLMLVYLAIDSRQTECTHCGVPLSGLQLVTMVPEILGVLIHESCVCHCKILVTAVVKVDFRFPDNPL